jgi:hypothetical protein
MVHLENAVSEFYDFLAHLSLRTLRTEGGAGLADFELLAELRNRLEKIRPLAIQHRIDDAPLLALFDATSKGPPSKTTMDEALQTALKIRDAELAAKPGDDNEKFRPSRWFDKKTSVSGNTIRQAIHNGAKFRTKKKGRTNLYYVDDVANHFGALNIRQ